MSQLPPLSEPIFYQLSIFLCSGAMDYGRFTTSNHKQTKNRTKSTDASKSNRRAAYL